MKPLHLSKTQIAVVDIGSNSVRMVIYNVSGRAFLPHYNERVMAGLGLGVAETKRLSVTGKENALRVLRRFSAILQGLSVEQVKAVATAAVRTAEDGPEFLADAIAALSHPIEVLTGSDEALLSAKGVAEGLHEAAGIVGDLGGSSLEFATIENGQVASAESHLLGPLAMLRAGEGSTELRKRVRRKLEKSSLLSEQGRKLYIVGGAWRALAKLHMGLTKYPLQQLHAYRMNASAISLIHEATQSDDPVIRQRMAKASQKRLDVLPYAGIILSETFHIGGFEEVVVSSHGLREGVVFDALEHITNGRDALLDSICLYLDLNDSQQRFANELFHWMLPVIRPPEDLFGERLIETRILAAACMFADTGARFHPDHRADMAYDHALRGPYANIDHLERAFVALATGTRYARNFEPRSALTELLDKQYVKLARQVGAVMRLGAVYSGRSADVLKTSKLEISQGALVLRVHTQNADMLSSDVERRLGNAADLFDLKSHITDWS
ncbi:MAG: Ppx/GppA family phosphatase [Pseudomonadota bacterium]